MSRSRHLFALVAFAALAAAVPASAQQLPELDTSATAGEKAIAKYLVEDSVGDVQLGRLGLAHAHNQALRSLARTLVVDHTNTAKRGAVVARDLAAGATMEPDTSAQIDLTHLARYSGAAFDREYVKTVIDAHKNDIQKIDDALEFSTNVRLRSYLTATRAVDVRHLAMATSARTALGEQ